MLYCKYKDLKAERQMINSDRLTFCFVVFNDLKRTCIKRAPQGENLRVRPFPASARARENKRAHKKAPL